MSNLVAKRYVKALLVGRDTASITAICNELKEISAAYANEKFVSIISSPDVKNSDKSELIVSLTTCSDSTKNLVQLLSSKKRLDIIPSIVEELNSQIAALDNSYVGVVYTSTELDSNYISSIEEQFSKKFDVKLSLTQNVCDYDGIKVDIDGLGVEIAFSKDRLKSQLIDHILKAV